MEIIFLNLNNIITPGYSLSITIGAFDGIHKGHLALVEYLIKGKDNDKTAVFTFDIHPDFLLSKTDTQGMINPIHEKAKIFENLNIDYLYILPREILPLTANQFHEILKKLNVRRIVVGRDFIYGAKKSGNINTLKQSFNVDVIDDIKYHNERISSTNIRKFLSLGKIDEIKHLLISDFDIVGKVIEGSHIGEKLGFRTANIDVDEKYHKLMSGVYKVKVIIDDEIYLGVANYGVNPTCNLLTKPRLEVHILDFKKEIYNKEIKVIFDKFIRNEINFNSKEELINQIQKDIIFAKE